MIARWLGNAIKAMAALAAAIMLGGCWDEVDLQHVGYVTALGVDYKDGQFEIYCELIGFTSVAKTEGQTSSDPSVSWVGHSEGETMFAALREMNRTTQYQISLEHLKSLVIHERAMKQIDEVLDALNRQRASRYTVWMFGTNKPIGQIFAPDVIFNRNPLISTLYTPNLMYQQVSAYRPINMQVFVQQFNEPASTVLLPNIVSDGSDWKLQSKPLKLNELNGVFLFAGRGLVGKMTDAELKGDRWVQPDFKQEVLSIQAEGKKATVVVDRSAWRLKGVTKGEMAKFKLEVKLHVHLVELERALSGKEIEEAASKQVEAELKQTYLAALAKHADIFQTRLNLYRYHNSFWKKHASKADWLPGKNDMSFDVRTKLYSSGKYDLD